MRYQIGEKLFVVHFNVGEGKDFNPFYIQPYLYNNNPVLEISLVKLTVKEHHKVPWSEDPEGEKRYDGYILVNEDGTEWANQYPTASYGQTSDEQNRRFHFHGEKEEFKKRGENGQCVECHLLTDWLENILRFLKYFQENKEKLPETANVQKENLLRLLTRLGEKLNAAGYKWEEGLKTYEAGYETPVVKIVKIREV